MRLSAGIVPVRFVSDEAVVLIIRAYRYWDFPKGAVDAGEQPLEAAIRELREETGLENPQFSWGESHVDTPVYARDKVARYFVAHCPKGDVYLPVSAELGRPEHHEFRWLRFDDASALLNERVGDVLQWARQLIDQR